MSDGPLAMNLTVESLALSPAEMRAYPRWYTDLLIRKRSESLSAGDVQRFVDNFGISNLDKQRIASLFGDRLVSVDPVQFYVYLRLCGHILQGQALRKELAFVSAPVPKPRPILSGKRKKDANPFRKPGMTEMDSFMSMMSGKSNKKARKRVTFDSDPPKVAEAAQRSIQELLRQQNMQDLRPGPPIPQPQPQPQAQPQPDEPDEPIPQNQFANVNIESVLHHGTSSVPDPPPPRKLTPNMTGPTQMVQMGVLGENTHMSKIADPNYQIPFQHQPQGRSQVDLQYPFGRPQLESNGRPYQGINHQSGLQSQGTGLQSQVTGLQSQSTGLQPQGLQSQGTGQASGLAPQSTGPGYTQSSGYNGFQGYVPQQPQHQHQHQQNTLLQPQNQYQFNSPSPRLSPMTTGQGYVQSTPQMQANQFQGQLSQAYAPYQQAQTYAPAKYPLQSQPHIMPNNQFIPSPVVQSPSPQVPSAPLQMPQAPQPTSYGGVLVPPPPPSRRGMSPMNTGTYHYQ